MQKEKLVTDGDMLGLQVALRMYSESKISMSSKDTKHQSHVIDTILVLSSSTSLNS